MVWARIHPFLPTPTVCPEPIISWPQFRYWCNILWLDEQSTAPWTEQNRHRPGLLLLPVFQYLSSFLCSFSNHYSVGEFATKHKNIVDPVVCGKFALLTIWRLVSPPHLSPMQYNPPPHHTSTDTGYPKPPSWEPPLIVSWSVVNLPPFSPFWGHTDCLPRFQLGPSGTIQEVASSHSQNFATEPSVGSKYFSL